MKSSFFTILLCALCAFCCCFLAGCASVMQTSAMLLEDREYSFFPDPPAAVEARKLDGFLYLKCPVRKYVRKHTLVRMAVTPSRFGGFQYEPAGPLENRFVWIRVSRTSSFPCPPDFEFDPAQDELERRLASAKPADYSWFELFSAPLFYGLDGEPDRMYTVLPLLETRSENSVPRIILAYADGFLVDFPASLIMTLTGSFWYLPLTKYAEE